jgi:hypothetical protein
MKIVATFNYDGKEYKRECRVENLARNWPDEQYAYFITPLDETKAFEVNIRKDEDGYLISRGHVVVIGSVDNGGMETIKAKIEFVDEYAADELKDNITSILEESVTKDYAERLMNLIFDDVREDLEDTSDLDHGVYTYRDIKYAIGRVLLKQYGEDI